MRAACCVVVLLLCSCAWAQDSPAWEQRLQARHQALVRQNGPGMDVALRAKLLAMRDEDQSARGFAHGQPKGKDKLAIAPNLGAIDGRLTTELKTIVAAKGWPTIRLVGIDASNGAMLVLTHSQDHEWQRSLLPKLELLARESKIDGSQLAVVVDKELVAGGKLQRYGTQFKFVDGQAMMFAVEDPDGLDKRREEVMLPPMEAYRKMLGEMYHVPVSDVIVRADAPK
jgi:hypothetical protein